MDSAPATTQEGNLITLKTEPLTEEVIVKVGPGIQSQVSYHGGILPRVPKSKPCPRKDSHQSKRRKRIHQGFEGTIQPSPEALKQPMEHLPIGRRSR